VSRTRLGVLFACLLGNPVGIGALKAGVLHRKAERVAREK
jgi:hypothetical protein